MLFYILMVIVCLCALGMLVAVIAAPKIGEVILVFALVGFLPALLVFGLWSSQANDLGAILAQKHIISVQEERIESLTTRLDSLSYPPSALLNADTPVAAIVKSISDAEKSLARAKTVVGVAIRTIEQRRLGLFSGVIWFVGDYTLPKKEDKLEVR